jgi:hypothetical protein
LREKIPENAFPTNSKDAESAKKEICMNKKNFFKLAGIMVIAIIVITCTPKKNDVLIEATQPQTQTEVKATQTNIEIETTAVQTQTQPETALYDYSKILNGDLSDFTGIWWLNGWGDRIQLMIDDGTLSDGHFISGFSYNKDGSYYWNQGYRDIGLSDGWVHGIYLYPVGVEIEAEDKTITKSDTTKIRIGTGIEPPNDEKSVFYME